MTGYICGSTAGFVESLQRVKQFPQELMRRAARKHAESTFWDSVFGAVYRAYEVALDSAVAVGSGLQMKMGASVAAKT